MSNQNRINIRQLPSFLPTQDFIKKEEQLKLIAYTCPAGAPTVGWGHVLEARDCLNIGDTITEDRALQFLESDMAKAYQALFRLVHVPLTDKQQTAIVSFIFNLGAGRFQSSTLRQKLNRKEYEPAAQEFGRWVYARHPAKGLIKFPGLVSRRRRERMLFLSLEYEITPLKPRTDILPFKYQPRLPGARESIWKKTAVIFVGLFKAGH